MTMDPIAIINRYYKGQDELLALLLRHSRDVAGRALAIARLHPELRLDLPFIEEAAMLHDIGIVRTDAPGIHCHGTEPYICHGHIGAEILRAEGLPRHARVAERHTGTGLTRQMIEANSLPLPPHDFLPETLEEQLVCYADKFYSKSHPDRVRSLADTERSLAKFGEAGVRKFRAWERLFSE